MRKLVLVCAVLVVPAVVAAKSFTGGKDIKWDCGKDGDVAISASKTTATLTGACKKVAVSGNDVKLVIENVEDLALSGNGITTEVSGTADEIVMNGNKCTATIGTLGELTVNGNDNSATYKKSKSKDGAEVQNNGSRNKIAKAKDEPKPKK